MKSPQFRVSAVVFAGFAVAACSKQQAAQPSPPPPEVGVIVAHAGAVPLTRQLVGRLAATRTAEVRARVPGIVQKQLYTEGTDVAEDQPLFQIDSAPLQAAMNQQLAALAQARATAANATAKAKRYSELSGKGVLAKQDYDDTIAAERTAIAAVKAAEAVLETAKLNLGYASITAPIAGRAGRARVTEGALVGQGEATPLTIVEQIDPIYVDFSQSATDMGELQRAQVAGKLKLTASDHVEVQVQLADGTAYTHPGTLSFTDLAVDPQTGTLSLRATLPNPERQLLPGMFVRVTITQGELASAFVIPQRAIQRDPQGAYAMVVGGDGAVQQKRLELGELRGSDWVVLNGLADGDQVIVSGLQKVRPDAPAKAVPQDQLDKPSPQVPGANASAPTKH